MNTEKNLLPLPEKLLASLKDVPDYDESSFRSTHGSGEQVVSLRINPKKNVQGLPDLVNPALRVPWSSTGYYLAERPLFTFDPLLHAGAYYVQEASSMFLEQAIKVSMDLDQPLKALDLCAAPGGKSTLIQAMITRDSLLVSNEVIRSRVPVLTENLVKWGSPNAVITNNDPDDFARLPAYFDLMVVDAPCSGSGLFRKDPSAIAEWTEEAVEQCSLRQRRILTAALPALASEGLLVYSTCSYSLEEDECIADWLVRDFGLEPVRIPVEARWNIVEQRSADSGAYGYRFFPNRLKGEGFFISCFRKKNSTEARVKAVRKNKIPRLSPTDTAPVRSWLAEPDAFGLYFQDETIFAFPASLETELATLSENLYIRHAGVRLGKLIKNELVPDHEFAVSGLLADQIPVVTLKKDEALQYLRKEEVRTEGPEGWALVRYQGQNLGWIKQLKNRVNNYYPKEWRILKSATK